LTRGIHTCSINLLLAWPNRQLPLAATILLRKRERVVTCGFLHRSVAAAVGGELGTAVVFMHELAPATAKTKGGCVVFMSVNAGIVFGILVAVIVNAAVPPGDFKATTATYNSYRGCTACMQC
jgi:hypothetical protein